MSLSPALTALRDRARRFVPTAAVLPGDLSDADVRHLVRRTTFGASPDLMADVRALGPAAWLEQQLAPATVDDGAMDGWLRKFPQVFAPVAQTRTGRNGNWDTMQALGFATVGRYAFSRRQLFEVVCDTWSNHLNVTSPSSDVWDTRHHYDAAVIRTHALGRFSDLLAASAKHPSMLRYLDAARSTRGAPNENYARELMELHTVGVGRYTEDDVRAAARVLTGMTVDGASEYRFDPRRHDGAAATVLGWSTPAHAAEDGERVIDDFLRFLAADRRTAENVCATLVRRFVSDEPVPALVGGLADVYQANDTAIVPVLRALFASAEFWGSKNAKTRRPMEGYLAAVRATGQKPNDSERGGMDSLYWECRELGHAPLAWAPPNGYPDVAAAWASAGSTLQRWNSTTNVVNGWYPNLARPDYRSFLPDPLPATYGGLADALARAVIQRPATPREVEAVSRFCDASPDTPLRGDSMWVGARLSYVVQTFLHSPGHMER